jgi:hypothetical protein
VTFEAGARCHSKITTELEQVGNPTSTTSHLKRRETKDAHGSAHFYLFINGFLN